MRISDWSSDVCSSDLDYETISPEQAKHAFIRRATEFLATRMAAMRSFSEASHRPDSRPSFSLLRILQRNRGKYIQTPGCNFTVTTNSPGLRVFWSGAYWLSDRKSTRLNSSHYCAHRMPSSA